MASSPLAPFPASLPNPKKRPSMSSQVSQSAPNKRTKMHPLRQTSFPANGNANAYPTSAVSARSETGSIANSTFSSMSASKAQPRGRGRPRKSLQVPSDEARNARESGSTTGGAKNSQAKSMVSGAHSGAGANAEDEAEDDEEEEEEHEVEDITDEQKRQVEKINVLLSQLTGPQTDRYNSYRMSKLKEGVVKRIINQTVSQSVPNGAVNTVQWFSKAFAIEIIERAREVQMEMVKAAEKSIELEKQARQDRAEAKQRELEDKERSARERDPTTTLPDTERRLLQQQIKTLKDEAEKYIPNKHRGGLLPDHLREAMRRYKADGDGGGFGFDGMSHPLLGVHGSAAWRFGDGATGQRLFR